jgi:hypothetical protein
MVQNCRGTLQKIELVVERNSSKPGRARQLRYAFKGKDEIEKITEELELHVEVLLIGLNVTELWV